MANNRRLNYQVGIIADTSDFQRSLNECLKSLRSLGKQTELVSNLQQASVAALDLASNLQKAMNPNTGKFDLSLFNEGLQRSGKNLEDYHNQLISLGEDGRSAFLKVADTITQAELPLKRTNKLMSDLWVTMKNTVRWQITTGILNTFTGSINTAFGYAKDLDSSLNSIRIVTGQSAEEMKEFAKQANEAAKALSTTTTDYTEASLIYYQQGLNNAEVEERTNATIKMANVSGQNAEITSEQLTAIWNNFDDGSKALEYYADVMVALGASTASSSDEIAKGIQKFAAVADTVGLSYEYAAAALATLTANTREAPEVVGNALKTLFARIQGLQLGETLDDGTDLNKYSKALNNVGVSIKDTNGELKAMDQILTETATKWQTLSKDQQTALAQTVAGVRQYNQFVSLMENWPDMMQNLATAMGSEGALQEQADIHAESWEAARDRVRASAEDIYDSLINPDFYIGMDKVITPVLNRVADIIDAFGGMQGTLAVLATLMNKVYGQQIAQSMRDMVTSLGFMTGKQQEQARLLQKQAADLAKNLAFAESDKTYINQKVAATKQLVELQGEVAKTLDQLTPRQQAQLQQDTQHIQNIYKLITAYSESAMQADTAFETSERKILDNAKAVSDFKIKLDSLKFDNKFNIKLDTTKASTALDQLLEKLRDLAPQYKNLSRINEEMERLSLLPGQHGQGASQEVLELAKALELVGETADRSDKFFTGTVDNYKQQTEELKVVVNTLKESLVSVFNIPESEVDRYISALQEVDSGTRGVSNATKLLDTEISRVTQDIQAGTYAQKDWADRLVDAGSAISQLSIAINSIQGLEEVFTDKNLSSTERMTRLLTNVGMLLPTLSSAYKVLNTQLGAQVVLQEAEVAIIGKGIAAKIAQKAMDAAILKGIMAENVQLLANIALRGTQLLLLGGMVLLGVVVKYIYDLVTAEEKAAESIKKANEAYEEQKQKVEDLKSELQSVKDRIEELNSLDTITTVEEEELRKLEEQNLLLERQIQLEEKLERTKREARAREIEEEFETASKSLQVKPDYTKQKYMPSSGAFDQVDVDTWWADIQQGRARGQINNKDFEKHQKEYYQWIEDNEQVLADWIDANSEAIRLAEQNYSDYIQDIEDGIIEETAEVKQRVQEMQAFLHDYARTPTYTEAEYQEIYIKPIIDHNEEKEFYKIFASEGKNALERLLDDSLKSSIRRAGITEEEFLNYIETIVVKAKEKINNVLSDSELTDDFISKLTDEDILIVASMQLEDGATFEDFYKKFIEIKNNEKISITITIGEAIEEATTALKTISEGEFLDDEVIENLKSKFQGIYDLASLEAMSLYDQARLIGEALITAYDPTILGAELSASIDTYKKDLDDINDQIDKMSKGLSLSERRTSKELLKLEQQKIEVELDLSKVEDQLEELNDFQLDDIEVNIDSSYIDAILGQMGAIRTATELIGEGFKVEAENVEKLMKTMPQLFEDAIVDMETGVVQLNQAIVNSVADTAYAEVALRGESLATILQQRINESQAEIDILNDLKRIAIENSSESARQEAIDARFTKEQKQIAARAIIQAKIQQAIQEQTASRTTAQKSVQDQNVMTDASAAEGQRFAANWRLAGEKTWQALQAAFKGAAADMAAFARGEAISGNAHLATITAEGFSKGSSQYSWSYEGIGTEDPDIAMLQKYLEKFDIQAVAGENDIKIEAIAGTLSEKLQEFGFNISKNDVLKGDFADKIINTGTAITDLANYERALSDTYYELGLDMNDLSRLVAGLRAPEDLKSSGLKDSKSSSDKQKQYTDEEKKKLEDILERYHEINREITRQSDLLDDIGNNTERAYGINKLKSYNRELKALEKQQANYNEKLREATEQWLPYDVDKLNNLFGEGVIQYKANGEIANYTQLLQKTVDDYNDKFLAQYNAFMKKYTETTDEDAKKLLEKEKREWEQRKALAEEQYKSRQDALKQYEDTRDTIQEIKDELEDVARQIQDNKLSQIEYKLEIILDVKSMKDALREFDKQAQEIFGDALTHGTGAMNRLGITNRPLNVAELDKDQAQAEADMYSIYAAQFRDLKALYEEANDATDRDRIMQDIMELQGKVLDSAEAIVEWVNSIEDLIPNAVDAAAERFKIFTDQLDHNTSVLDTIKELYALQGVTYKTMDGFNKLQKTSQEKLEAQVANAQLQRAWYLEAQQNLQEAQAKLDSLGGDEGDIRYDTYKKARDAYLTEFNEAQEAYLSLAKEAMETAKEMYLEQIDKAIYDFGQKVSKGLGLDLLQDKYDHYIEEDERYFDKVNEAYQTLSWYNKLQEDIDSSTNSAHKERLQALQKEIDLRREGGKLSQYDLDILNAKYNVLQAQAALEDAQNAKNTLRLVRDRQGNWNYQYTADPTEIENKEQELLDAQIEWYNIAKEQVKDITGKIIDTWKECEDKIKEIYTDMTLTDQERSDKAAEIYKYYTDKIKYLEEEKQVAIKDMNEAGAFNAISTIKLTGKEVVDFSEITADDVKTITETGWDDILDIVTEGGDALRDIMGENAEIIDIFDNVYAKDLDNMTANTDKFEDNLRETLDQCKDDFLNFEDTIKDVADNTGTSMEDLADTIDQVSDSTDELRDRGLDAADVLWDLIDAAEEAAYSYADMADSIWEAVEALRALAQEQVDYVQSQVGGDTYDDLNADIGPSPEDIDDYSLWFAQQRAQGKDIFGSDYSQYWDYRANKRGPNATSVTNEQLDSIFRKADAGDQNAQKIVEGVLSGGKFHDLIKKYPVGFDTGGYTGEFENGKLALLHEKELVLNKDDTKNMLSAVSIVRDIGPSILASIEKALDSKAMAAISLLAQGLNTQSIEPTAMQLDQTIHIDEVSFPNATSSDEIKNAFASLANDAAQWAKIRKI